MIEVKSNRIAADEVVSVSIYRIETCRDVPSAARFVVGLGRLRRERLGKIRPGEGLDRCYSGLVPLPEAYGEISHS